jgi:hypothetical protein
MEQETVVELRALITEPAVFDLLKFLVLLKLDISTLELKFVLMLKDLNRGLNI